MGLWRLPVSPYVGMNKISHYPHIFGVLVSVSCLGLDLDSIHRDLYKVSSYLDDALYVFLVHHYQEVVVVSFNSS